MLPYWDISSMVNQIFSAFYDYWTPENPTNDFPQPNILGNKDDVALARLSIVDGSFIKIKNITLGYTFPKA